MGGAFISYVINSFYYHILNFIVQNGRKFNADLTMFQNCSMNLNYTVTIERHCYFVCFIQLHYIFPTLLFHMLHSKFTPDYIFFIIFSTSNHLFHVPILSVQWWYHCYMKKLYYNDWQKNYTSLYWQTDRTSL